MQHFLCVRVDGAQDDVLGSSRVSVSHRVTQKDKCARKKQLQGGYYLWPGRLEKIRPKALIGRIISFFGTNERIISSHNFSRVRVKF